MGKSVKIVGFLVPEILKMSVKSIVFKVVWILKWQPLILRQNEFPRSSFEPGFGSKRSQNLCEIVCLNQ